MINTARHKNIFSRWHIDPFLLIGIFMLICISCTVLYSIGGNALVYKQLVRVGIALVVMLFLAQLPPHFYFRWTPYIFGLSVLLLIAVLVIGHTQKGAQRWIDLGFTKFQPSEIMKLIMPFMTAYYISQYTLPPSIKKIAVSLAIIIIPTLLIEQQPDLGTAILVGVSGGFVLLLSGMSWLYIGTFLITIASFIPILWLYIMRDYQRLRVLTLFNPQLDPYGAGYHIIQSKIAIGSGGLFGKGLFGGTQSQLEFLPEPHTDFIFSVFSEEFGLVGIIILLLIYIFIISRGLWIANKAEDPFTKLVAGSITLTFFVYIFVNISMVSGLLPVVGIPLALISYGGTSIVTLLAGFGIIMSINTHRKFNAKY